MLTRRVSGSQGMLAYLVLVLFLLAAFVPSVYSNEIDFPPEIAEQVDRGDELYESRQASAAIDEYLQAIEWVETNQPDEKELIALLNYKTGSAYNLAALYVDAEKYFRKAQPHLDPKSLEDILCDGSLSLAMVLNGKTKEALELASLTETRANEEWGESREILEIRHLAAVVARIGGDYRRAEGVFRDLIKKWENELASVQTDEEKNEIQFNILGEKLELAKCAELIGNYQAAVELFSELVDKTKGMGPALELPIQLNMAKAQHFAGDSKGAAQILKKIVPELKEFSQPHYASGVEVLGISSMAIGAYRDADQYLSESVQLMESLYGTGHPGHRAALNNLGILRIRQGKSGAAVQLQRQMIEYCSDQNVFVPSILTMHWNLALALAADGQFEEAYQVLWKTWLGWKEWRDRVHSFGTELELLATSSRVSYFTRNALGLLMDWQNYDWVNENDMMNFVFELVEASKGTVVRALAQRSFEASNTSDDEIRIKHKDWRQSGLASFHSEAKQPNGDLSDLDKEFARSFSGEKVLSSPNLSQFQNALGKDEILIHYFTRIKLNIIEDLVVETRIAAIVVQNEQVRLEEFAYSDSVRTQVTRFREDIDGDFTSSLVSGVPRLDHLKSGENLRKALLDPIDISWNNIKRVYVSGVDPIALVPFAAFPHPETGKYLVENVVFCTVKNAWDCLENPARKLQSAALFGAVDYACAQGDSGNSNPESGWGIPPVSDLPNSDGEISGIAALCEEKGLSVTLMKHSDASEESLKAIENPSILHLATHSFFSGEDWDTGMSRGIGGTQTISEQLPLAKKPWDETPFDRSAGILLAGCNCVLSGHQGGTEDGVVTTRELRYLALGETDLVVVSGCESGLGESFGDQGVFGIQWTLATAGTRNLVLSLWNVPDQETSELMQFFYQVYLDGQPSDEALAVAQRKWIRKCEMNGRYPQPNQWAGFTAIKNQVGDPKLKN